MAKRTSTEFNKIAKSFDFYAVKKPTDAEGCWKHENGAMALLMTPKKWLVKDCYGDTLASGTDFDMDRLERALGIAG